MRRIKFRGRSINYVAANDSYWAYGLLVNDDPPEIECDDGDIYRVNDKTVGQCTGLEDADGREIYEGDIVTVEGWRKPTLVEWFDANAQFVIDGSLNLGLRNSFMRVIGNIHDNPELLRLTKAGGFEK